MEDPSSKNTRVSSATFGYWNINGHRSKYLGDKLIDAEFLNVINECDIIGLGELQSEEKVDIPGFKRIEQKIRDKNFLGPKVAGGVGVFVKKNFEDRVEFIPNTCDDSIWIWIKDEDIYLGTYYVSPRYSSAGDIDFLNTLNKEISQFSSKGKVFVQGDLNARTSTDPDFVQVGKHPDSYEEEMDEHEIDDDPNLRNSEDRILNVRGKELLDLCKLNKLIITNGRKSGDPFGKFTCHKWNGSSVVDYLLSPISSFDSVTSFIVGDFIPWLSDHCIIKSKIKFRSKYPKNVIDEKLMDTHPGFVWNENSLESYRKNLSSEGVKGKVQTLMMAGSLNVAELAAGICDLMIDTAKSSGTKTKKSFNELNKNEQPWFDKECKLEKEKLNGLAKKVRKSPTDNNARSLLFDTKKNFKRIVLAKKRRHRKKLVCQLQDNSTDRTLKEHWKLFRKISPKNISDPRQPSMRDFQKYFEKLSKSSRAQNIPSLSQEIGPLDQEISPSELAKAGSKLKQGKAHGLDIICNEMIAPLINNYPRLVLKLFNKILMTSDTIPEWVTGLIVPIFKDGSKMDPNNYRGITLMSCLGKLFLSILNARLLEFVLKNGILGSNQLGFVPGNRTSDAHIIINNIVNKICHRSNKKLFSCFVDFRKAFDLVPRDILLGKLLKLGINGKFFNVIRNIYTSDRACVKLNGKRSESFRVDIGVRQGCILSPLLFNIFLCDLAKSLQEIECPTIGNLNSLFWADDLVMFSDSEIGLQNMLSTLEKYCKENELVINTKKTKCMTFNKTGRLLLRPFYLNNVQLECVRCYKYLGFVITPSGECGTGLKDLRDRAFRAFMKIKRDLGENFNSDVPLILSLINALIKPILLYACDFWGCLKLPQSNPIETFYLSMLKQVLGVQKQTTNNGVLLELGKTPLSFEARKFSIKNWERIIRGNANVPLQRSLQESVDLGLPWTTLIKSNLEKIGLLNFYTGDYSSKPPFVYKKLFQRLCDIFHQETFEKISGPNSKLRTYALFKKDQGYEEYLTKIKNVAVRKNVTKFRLSNHKLMIEVGRHKKLPANERYCPFCPENVEDESHFLFHCPIYRFQRSKYLASITGGIHNFDMLPDDQKLELLFCHMENDICNFVSSSMEIREFLAEKPKMHQ